LEKKYEKNLKRILRGKWPKLNLNEIINGPLAALILPVKSDHFDMEDEEDFGMLEEIKAFYETGNYKGYSDYYLDRKQLAKKRLYDQIPQFTLYSDFLINARLKEKDPAILYRLDQILNFEVSYLPYTEFKEFKLLELIIVQENWIIDLFEYL
jgi:hypothetical protein